MKKNIAILLILLPFFTATATAQCVSGNCQDGQGVFLFEDGTRYVGDFKSGEINGYGVAVYPDSSKYLGEWKSRFPEGRGTFTQADGKRIHGIWKRGQLVEAVSKITMTTPEPKTISMEKKGQTGCVSGDCQNGQGTYVYADGSTYTGTFRQGKRHGNGEFRSSANETYTGEFQNNYFHGKGKLVQASGKMLDGIWEQGEFQGIASATLQKEGCVDGDCQNGKGTYVFKNGKATYKGTFINSKANGKGECQYANGDAYLGEWQDGVFHGVGTLTLADGTKVQGQWVRGAYVAPVAPSSGKEPGESINFEDALQVKVWAVVVGVASYTAMPALRYTDDDAYRVYAFLKSPQGGAVADDRIKLLIDEDATKENILKSMQDIYLKAGSNDLVVMYFSGHGFKGSFLPFDFDGSDNKLFYEEVAGVMNRSQAKYKLFIADACHSGSFEARGKALDQDDDLQPFGAWDRIYPSAGPGTALILSSKTEETSLESSGLRQGVFSHFLIRGLKGDADNNKDRLVTVQELFNYVYNNVRSYTGLRQSPVIKGDFDAAMPVSIVR